jgi:competence protein ComEC
MRTFWHEAPLVRIVFAIVIGIGIAIFVNHIAEESFLTLCIASSVCFLGALGTIVISFLSITKSYKYRFVYGAFLLITLIAFGYVLTWFQSSINSGKHFSKLANQSTFLLANVIEPPMVKEKVVVVNAKITSVVDEFGSVDVHGKMLINLMKDSKSISLKYGDVIVFKNNSKLLEEPKNPNEFSYKLYQSFHTVYHRIFLKNGDWQLVQENQGYAFFKTIYILREKFMLTLDKYIDDKNDFAVSTALMLGYRDYMTEDVIRAYSSSGALHVLSVSGLHVGIMFLMFNFLLMPIKENTRMRMFVKSGIIILMIWVYACLTGLSPSVLRSAAMFTLLQLARSTTRKPNTYNVLGGSALVLIIWDPFIVTEIGFRLSYLAVIGIVFLQPLIYNTIVIERKQPPKYRAAEWYAKPFVFLRRDLGWFFRYGLPDFCWQLTAVSIAAQVATFPLGLYYFHQFPVMFLISNIIVIPLSNLLLFAGTALFAFNSATLDGAADLIGYGFENVLMYLNKFIFFIDSFSFALIENISITMVQMVLWYLFIFGVCWLLLERRVQVLIGSLLLVLCLLLSYGWQSIEVAKQNIFVVYHVPKHSGMAIITKGKAYTMMDDYLQKNESAKLFHVKHHWWACGVDAETEMNSSHYVETPLGKLISYSGKRILVVEQALPSIPISMQKKLDVDVVVLNGNSKIYINKLARVVDFSQAVFSTNVPRWRTKYWKKDCETLGVSYWDVAEKGAYLSYL